jgi:hypothetical protein
MQIADAVGVEIPDDWREPVVFADPVECLGEVVEDLDESDGVGSIESDVVHGGVLGIGGAVSTAPASCLLVACPRTSAPGIGRSRPRSPRQAGDEQHDATDAADD